jgi:DNA-3-methyladenine glycosylase
MNRVVPLSREFFDRNAAEVAKALIGCLLARRAGSRLRLAKIVETEAYVGEHDLACHAKAGRTARTDPMYGAPGHAYVYFVYGIHHCLNAVCGPGGAPNAVLIRAIAPLDEADLSALDWPAGQLAPLLHSGVGPGNLCRALEVSLLQNRVDLCDAKSDLIIAPRIGGVPTISLGPRIGVDYAGDWARAPLRFWETGNAHVSKMKGTRARAKASRPRGR